MPNVEGTVKAGVITNIDILEHKKGVEAAQKLLLTESLKNRK